MFRRSVALIFLAACAACDRQPADQVAPATQAAGGNAVQAAPESIAPGEAGGLPDDRNLVAEGPIDPDSGQGAGQVLQSYAALLEQRRFAEARRLWSDGGRASELSEEGFAEAYAKYAEIHAEIGAPGPVEGAAGSAYVELPIRFYGRLRSGAPFSSIGRATLRRVNDVPGSTVEQRRWHIYRVEVQPPL